MTRHKHPEKALAPTRFVVSLALTITLAVLAWQVIFFMNFNPPAIIISVSMGFSFAYLVGDNIWRKLEVLR
jgi:hypothetical protein